MSSQTCPITVGSGAGWKGGAGGGLSLMVIVLRIYRVVGILCGKDSLELSETCIEIHDMYYINKNIYIYTLFIKKKKIA